MFYCLVWFSLFFIFVFVFKKGRQREVGEKEEEDLFIYIFDHPVLAKTRSDLLMVSQVSEVVAFYVVDNVIIRRPIIEYLLGMHWILLQC